MALAALPLPTGDTLVPLPPSCAAPLRARVDAAVLRWTSLPPGDLSEWVASVTASNAVGHTARWCLHRPDQGCAGVIGFIHLDPTPELGWWLGQRHRGRNLAYMASRACLDWAAINRQPPVELVVAKDNSPSSIWPPGSASFT